MPAVARRSRSSFASDSLTSYLRDIGQYHMLSRDEERSLAVRIQAGDADALDQLVCANLRFVVLIAKKYQTTALPLADLVNEGNLGLMQAAARFDGTKGVKFISYAVWWIRQSIVQALADHGHTVRVPVTRTGTLFRVRRRADLLRHELGREPTHREIAEGTELSEEEVSETLPLGRSALSLDAPTPNTDMTWLDYLADETMASPEQGVIDVALEETVNEALTRLRPREAKVVRLYFGLDGNKPMTLEAIGASLGVTRERARQLKERALEVLRRSTSAKTLAAFHGD